MVGTAFWPSVGAWLSVQAVEHFFEGAGAHWLQVTVHGYAQRARKGVKTNKQRLSYVVLYRKLKLKYCESIPCLKNTRNKKMSNVLNF